jgi:predicted porin
MGLMRRSTRSHTVRFGADPNSTLRRFLMSARFIARSLALSALGLACVAPVLAQSSVTLYGRVNVTAESIDFNGKKTKELVNNASRIGFKGIEDLGGGLKAGFVLEHRFSIDTGLPASTFWGGQSEAYLSGGFGTIRLGQFTSEAYFATADWISFHNHDTGNSEDKLYAYLGRNANKVAYRTPEFVKGLTAEASISLGEGAPRLRNYDGAINYASGPLTLGFGYESANASKQFALRAAYEMGAVTLGGYVQSHDDVTLGKRTLWRGSVMFTSGMSEFHFNLGQAGEFDKLANSDARQFTLGYNYNLSKRTKVYGFYTKVDDEKGVSAFGADFSSLAVGVRHNF